MNAFLTVLLAVIGYSASQPYVWDFLKPTLSAAEVMTILTSRDYASLYPNFNAVPVTNFDCTKKHSPGFYADVEAQCQVFHRCDINGNHTSYLCVNSTVFNQITLVCDYFFNVDCARSVEFETFANSRLYSQQELFDTPPADYIPQSQSSQSGLPIPPIKPVRLPTRPLLKPQVLKPVTRVPVTMAPTTAVIRDQDMNGDSNAATTTEMLPTPEQPAETTTETVVTTEQPAETTTEMGAPVQQPAEQQPAETQNAEA